MTSFFKPITDVFMIIFNFLVSTIEAIGISDRGTVIVLAVILLTLLVRLAVLPFSIKSANSMKKTQAIQPEVKKIQEKYKNDPQKANAEIMKIYKENNVSMTGGCIHSLLPLPILMALYYIFPQIEGIKGASFLFISNLDSSIMTLLKQGEYLVILLPILSFLSTYLPSYLMSKANPTNGEAGGMDMSSMSLGMSAVMAVMSFNFQAILVIYWVIGGAFQLIQTYFLNYRPVAIERKEKEALEASSVVEKNRFAMDEDSSKKKKKKK